MDLETLQLKRSVARWRVAALAMGAVLLLCAADAAKQVFSEVRVTTDGKQAVVLAPNGLWLMDAAGKTRAQLSLDPGGNAAFVTFDANGQAQQAGGSAGQGKSAADDPARQLRGTHDLVGNGTKAVKALLAGPAIITHVDCHDRCFFVVLDDTKGDGWCRPAAGNPVGVAFGGSHDEHIVVGQHQLLCGWSEAYTETSGGWQGYVPY